MSVATSTAIGIAGAAAAAGGVASAAIGSSAAGHAADTQAAAANNAAQLQFQLGQQNLGFQEGVYNNAEQNIAPWYSSGVGALSSLDNLLGITPGPPPAMLQQSPSIPNPNTPGGNFAPSPFSLRGPNVGNFDIAQAQPLSRLQAINSNTAGIVPARIPGQPGGINDAAGSMGGNGFDPKFVNGQPVGSAPLGSPGNPISASGLPQQTSTTAAPGGFGSLLAPYPGGQFVSPDSVTEQNDPGYQFRLQQGLKALDNSAASRGDLLSGNNEQAINQFGQDYASNEYGNVYNRALNNYQTNYNTYQQQQANTFNRLAAIAGIGQTAASQLNSAGANAANNVTGIDLGSGAQIGQNLNNAGAA